MSSHKKSGVLESDSKKGRHWTTSFLLLALYVALLYYVSFLAPNHTPSTDVCYLKKLFYLKGEDGFKMNKVIVGLWYIMGLWALVYSMLLIPSARSSKSKIAVWPFVVLSTYGGAYVLIPYFILWRPPPSAVEKSEVGRWPLNFLESKLTALVCLGVGMGLFLYAGLANADDWKEFHQYFWESKFIHIMSLDFILLSSFAPFWVYNDITVRSDKGYWLLPVSLVPLLGPALYLILRPPLGPTSSKQV